MLRVIDIHSHLFAEEFLHVVRDAGSRRWSAGRRPILDARWLRRSTTESPGSYWRILQGWWAWQRFRCRTSLVRRLHLGEIQTGITLGKTAAGLLGLAS